MANTVRIKRRAAGGAAGSPATLENAELAFNEQDSVLYYGVGTGGAGGSATTIIPIGGPGAFTPIAHVGSGAGAHANVVAAGNSGFMTGADKTKLDGIASGATANTGTVTSFSFTNGNGITGTVATSTTTPTLSFALGAVTGTSFNGVTALSSTTPATDGTAAVGVSTTVARSDHVHQMPLLSAVGAPTGNVSLNSQRIVSLADPVSAQDAATKNYCDLLAQGLDAKGSVRAATTAAGTLASSFANASVIDGVTLATGNRILIKDQAAPAENGIYTVNASGAPTRATAADAWTELPSAYVFVEEGAVNADMGFVCTVNSGGTLNTTAITFVQFSGAGQITAGAGLTKTANTLSISAGAITNAMLANGAVANLSGVNSGDNAVNTLYSGLVTNATHTGDATGATALTVVKINGTLMSGLATGILKNTTGTGVPSIAVAGDFPTLNQNTTGTAANVTGTVAVANGGTGVTTSTGSGANVLSTSPTLTTPVLGVATGTSFNSITGLASVAPLIDGTATVGVSTLTARQDHIHPTDTTRAAVAQTMYVGTTALAINRASAALALTGITSIDGTASNITGIAALANGGLGAAVNGFADGAFLKKSGTAFVAATLGTDYLSNASNIDGGTF